MTREELVKAWDTSNTVAEVALPTKVCVKCDRGQPMSNFRLALAKGKSYRRGVCNGCLKDYWRERTLKKKQAAHDARVAAAIALVEGLPDKGSSRC